jgi:hypothetical protein
VPASAALIPVYGSFALWGSVAFTGAFLGSVAGLLPRLLSHSTARYSALLQFLLLAAAQFLIGPILALRSTTIAGFIPTGATLSNGVIDTVTSFKYIISVNPPLSDTGGGLMALWTMTLWSAALAVFFAVQRARTVTAAAAIGVVLIEFVVAALLGTATGFYPVLIGTALAVIALVWVSWDTGRLELGRPFSVTGLLVTAIAASLAVGFILGLFAPVHRTLLRDLYDPPISPYDYTSPLSTLRSYIKKHKNDPLLTVTGLPEKTPVRLAVMDSFDGVVWNLSDSRESKGSADYRRVGTSLNTNTNAGTAYTATFSVNNGLSSAWFPLAGIPRTISFAHSTATPSDDLYFNPDTDTALLPSTTTAGLTYTVSGTIPATPSESVVARTSGLHTAQPGVHDVPQSVTDLAQAWTHSGGADGSSAQKIADQLRTSGWFSHGLAGDYPSLAGHSSYRVNALLESTSMVGDSEQYASAMALMARELGLSSRVVFGFVPKDRAGNISAERTKHTGGHNQVTFTGNDVEAWVEINLEGYGWVSFYPTPEETKVPDKNQNTTPPDPQTLVRQPSVPLQDPLRDEKSPTGTSVGGTKESADAPAPLWSRILQGATTVALYGSPVWILLAAGAIILLIKRSRKNHWRSGGSPRLRVENGWRYLVALARWSGVPAHDLRGTRRARGRAIEEALHLPEDSVFTLSEQADYASFAPGPLDDASAQEYWRGVDAVERDSFKRASWVMRWKARLSLQGLVEPHVPPFLHGLGVRLSRMFRRGHNPAAETIHEEGRP